MDSKQRDEKLANLFNRLLGTGQWVDTSLVTDTAAGTATLGAHGIIQTPWRWQDKRMQRTLSRVLKDANFQPDRARTDWAEIPVAVPGPVSTEMHLVVHLPNGGKGFQIDGASDASAQFAGQAMTRTTTIDKAVLTMDERLEVLGGEIAAAAIPEERDRFDSARAALPKLLAPLDVTRVWMINSEDGPKLSQLVAINAVLETAIGHREPDDATPFTTRASIRRSMGDLAGTVADYTQAVAIAPDVETYLARAQTLYSLGQVKDALADAQKARAIDPASENANESTATYLAETGDLAGATALLDRRIALGGDRRDSYRRYKAGVLGDYGDPQAALALLDTLIADKPGNPELLNARCWVKGTRKLLLDTALKDCTEAIELSSNAFAALDSRAVVWFRLGRYAEALRDLDAVLAQVPGLAESRFVRAVVEQRLVNTSAATADLDAARKLDPGVERRYARYGISY